MRKAFCAQGRRPQARLVSGRGAQRMTYHPKACLLPRWEPPSGRSPLERIQSSLATLQRLKPALQVQRKPVQPIGQEQIHVQRR